MVRIVELNFDAVGHTVTGCSLLTTAGRISRIFEVEVAYRAWVHVPQGSPLIEVEVAPVTLEGLSGDTLISRTADPIWPAGIELMQPISDPWTDGTFSDQPGGAPVNRMPVPYPPSPKPSLGEIVDDVNRLRRMMRNLDEGDEE